jgi:signal transduction histidine kinase
MMMNRLFKPSLGRRLVMALLLAFSLVTVALVAQDYWHVRTDFAAAPESALVSEIRQVGRTLDRFSQRGDVEAILRAMQSHANDLRHEQGLGGELLVELRDAAGRPIWPQAGASIVNGPLPPRGQIALQLGDRRYRVTQVATRHGYLVMAEPYPGDWRVLQLLVDNLWPSLLIAFPLVLLPMWLAVRQGLKPLRRLSGLLAHRTAQDLSPLGLDLQYIELQPVIDSFNALLDKLRHQIQRERAFVQDAAHELRTPMAVIAAQAHLLSQAADELQRHQAKDALEGAIERASHMAQQLLALATLDEAQSQAVRTVNLPHLLQQQLAQAMPLAQQRHMDIELDAPDALHTDLHVIAFQSVLGNLIDNAIRYGRDGGRIMVTLSHAPDTLCMTVVDDGPGIPAAQQPFVFDRFVRGEQGQVKGSGLGLAIVVQGAHRLGGQVRLTPGLHGHGVGFEVTWPHPSGANPRSNCHAPNN